MENINALIGGFSAIAVIILLIQVVFVLIVVISLPMIVSRLGRIESYLESIDDKVVKKRKRDYMD